MKWIFGRTAMWTWATLALATMAFAAVQDPQLPEGDGKKDPADCMHARVTAWTALSACTSTRTAGKAWSRRWFPMALRSIPRTFRS